MRGWGSGSSPAQLALAVLADCLDDDDRAVQLHELFKWQVVQHLPHEGWTLNQTDVLNAVRQIEQELTDGNCNGSLR